MAVNGEIDFMIDKLDLEPKRKTLGSKLSGGMKRKLSVGIALCGYSKVRRNYIGSLKNRGKSI